MAEFYIEFHFFFLKICLKLFSKSLEKYENLVLVTAFPRDAFYKTKNNLIIFFFNSNFFPQNDWKMFMFKRVMYVNSFCCKGMRIVMNKL